MKHWPGPAIAAAVGDANIGLRLLAPIIRSEQQAFRLNSP